MGNTAAKETLSAPSVKAAEGAPTEKKKCKACCACPETKRARDQCIVERGEENCKDLIEAHLSCMRSQGFNI